MDASVLKAFLSEQELAYHGVVEIMLNQVSENVKALQFKVSDLTVSLEYTQREVDDMKKDLKQCRNEKTTDGEVIKKLKEDLQARNNTLN